MSTLLNYLGSFIIGAAISALPARARAQGNRLDQYIQQAFAGNEGLHAQQFSLDKSLAALDEARSLFLPNVSLQGSYTKAAGGRAVDIPVGDLLNSVYQTLNKLTASQAFPHLQNQSFLLNPDNFYDVHVHTTLPLVNEELWYNRKMHQEAISASQAAVNVYKRELVRNIKVAYFQCYQALMAIRIYSDALALVRENIRVNQSFYANGVRNGTSLLRAQTEQQQDSALLIRAQGDYRNAEAYFDFLLNRPETDSVIMDTAAFVDVAGGAAMAAGPAAGGIEGREELSQWRSQQRLSSLELNMEQSYLVPKVSTFLDLGSQGVGTVNGQTAYYFFGLSLEWDLFAGGQHHYRARQADYDIKSAQAGYDQTEQVLEMQLTQARNDYASAVAVYRSARTQATLAEKYYHDQLKAYKEGQLLYIELLDAQRQLTDARLQVAQAVAGVQIAAAGLERDQATYPLQPTKS